MILQQKLRQQAKIDYQQARGTAHKELLRNARRALQQDHAAQRDKIRTIQRDLEQIDTAHEQKLRQALTDYLVHERLTEVAGIGQARKEDIIRYIYRGSLADLYRAQQLPGIGEQTQALINQWARRYQQHFPSMLQEDFPGKESITAAYQKLVVAEKQKMTAAEKEMQELQARLDRIETELNWLDAITVGMFYQALKNSGTKTSDLNRYIEGVFAEWEAAPDWFQETLAVAGANWQPDGKILGNSYLMTPVTKHWRIYLAVIASIVVLYFGCLSLAIMLSGPKDMVLSTHAAPEMEAATLTLIPEAQITIETTPKITLTPEGQPGIRPTATFTPTPTPSPTAIVAEVVTEMAAPQLQLRVIVSAARVREEADTMAAIVATVKANDILSILETNEDGSWFLIELPDGSEGWIGSSVVTLIDTGIEAP